MQRRQDSGFSLCHSTMSESELLTPTDLLAHSDRLQLSARAGDETHVARAAKAAHAALQSISPPPPHTSISLAINHEIDPLARAATALSGAPHPQTDDVAWTLDLRDSLQFDNHPAYTFAYLVTTATWLAGSLIAMPVLDHSWLDSLRPSTPLSQNPAKRLAQRFYAHAPLLWAVEEWQLAIAHDWRLRILRYAENAAMVASFADMQHGWSMARFPNFWPNALCVARIGEASPADPPNTHTLQKILQRRRFDAAEIALVGADRLAQALHLLYLGEWVALYLAALNDVDPADCVPLHLLGIAQA
jgi:hypothetical protein